MANKYVRQDASGTASGDDWTNAYTTLAAANTGASRGDTIFVADGSYAGVTFNKEVSGTSVIAIKKATESSHGTDTGWDSSYGDGQATITSTVYFTKSYYTFDGVVGSGYYDSLQGDYGFIFDFPGGANQDCIYIQSVTYVDYSNLIFRHIAFKGISGDYTKQGVRCHSQCGNGDGVQIAYCYFDGLTQAFSAAGYNTDNFLFEHNVCKNLYGSGTPHAEWINTAGGGNASKIRNSTIRFNFFIDSGSTGIIVANNSDIEDTIVYGNLFIRARGGNGTIAGTSNAGFVRCKVYNNTFSDDFGTPSGWFTAGTTGRDADNEAYNNLVWGTSASRMSGVGQITADYNAYFNCTNIPTEINGQTAEINPFVDSVGNNYNLAINTDSGADLGSPYNIDYSGNTRLTWSRGAYEFRQRRFKRLGSRLKFKALSS